MESATPPCQPDDTLRTCTASQLREARRMSGASRCRESSRRVSARAPDGLARLKTHPPKEVCPIVVNDAAAASPDRDEIAFFLGADQRHPAAGSEECCESPGACSGRCSGRIAPFRLRTFWIGSVGMNNQRPSEVIARIHSGARIAGSLHCSYAVSTSPPGVFEVFRLLS